VETLTKEETTLLSVAEVAERLGTSQRHVARAIKAGKIPAFNIGLGDLVRLRVRESDLSAFIEQRQYKPERLGE
jgi:excisionase family DNA binding protein